MGWLSLRNNLLVENWIVIWFWDHNMKSFINSNFLFVIWVLVILFIVWSGILSFIFNKRKKRFYFCFFFVFLIYSSISVMIVCTYISSLTYNSYPIFNNLITLTYFIFQWMVHSFKYIMRILAFKVFTIKFNTVVWAVSDWIRFSSFIFFRMKIKAVFIVMSLSNFWTYLRFKPIHKESISWNLILQ